MLSVDGRAAYTPDRSARNAICESLWVPHVLVRLDEEVMQQLAGFSLLQRKMVFHHDALHEVLVNDFAVPLPYFAIVCDQNVVATCDEVMRDVAVRAVTVDAGLLVDELFHKSTVSEYDGRCRSEFKGEDSAVSLAIESIPSRQHNIREEYLCPFCEPIAINCESSLHMVRIAGVETVLTHLRYDPLVGI